MSRPPHPTPRREPSRFPWALVVLVALLGVAAICFVAINSGSPEKPSCEEAFQVEDCSDQDAENFDRWGENLSDYNDADLLASYDLSGSDVALVGFGICRQVELGNSFAFWWGEMRLGTLLSNIERNPAAELWESTVDVLCPDLASRDNVSVTTD